MSLKPLSTLQTDAQWIKQLLSYFKAVLPGFPAAGANCPVAAFVQIKTAKNSSFLTQSALQSVFYILQHAVALTATAFN
jgi:hypothetical protein